MRLFNRCGSVADTPKPITYKNDESKRYNLGNSTDFIIFPNISLVYRLVCFLHSVRRKGIAKNNVLNMRFVENYGI